MNTPYQYTLFDANLNPITHTHPEATFTFLYNGRCIGVYVHYSQKRRRSIYFRIDRLNAVTVIAPNRTSHAEIERLLCEKIQWLLRGWKRISDTPAPLPNLLHTEGKVFYLGHAYTIELVEKRGDVNCEMVAVQLKKNKRLRVFLPSDRRPHERHKALESLLKQWLSEKAAQVLSRRTAHYATRMGHRVAEIKIGDQKTRWGSCSPYSKKIRYNFRVVMLPLDLLDYIVVHELAHLKVANHSPAFWNEVARILPDTSSRRKRLNCFAPKIPL